MISFPVSSVTYYQERRPERHWRPKTESNDLFVTLQHLRDASYPKKYDVAQHPKYFGTDMAAAVCMMCSVRDGVTRWYPKYSGLMPPSVQQSW
jgi:hypothetical protein